MSVSKEEIVNLHRRIDDHKAETKSDYHQLLDSMKDLPVAITKLASSVDHSNTTTDRLEKSLGDSTKELVKLGNRLTTVESEQKMLKESRGWFVGFGSKLLLIILGLLTTAISALAGVIVFRDVVI